MLKVVLYSELNVSKNNSIAYNQRKTAAENVEMYVTNVDFPC